jgi:hypothetical protein
MTFTDLLTQSRTIEQLRDLWIVLDASTAADFTAKQDAFGSTVHRINLLAGPGNDPRFATCADLVTEISPGGLHAHLFAHLNQAAFSTVVVVRRAELDATGWFV